jgi:hypothetical protein
MTEHIVLDSTHTHDLDVSIERVDIADWLSHLGNEEYKRCCPGDHIACGFTHSDDGRPMSINVEVVGGTLLIQQYVGEVFEPHLCRMVSLSDVFPASGGRTQTKVVWTLSVEPLDENRCRFVNRVMSLSADPTVGHDFDRAAAARQAATEDHVRRETPLYGESIAQSARNSLLGGRS